MGYNQFIINGATKFDLTSDTVDAAHLAQGYTAHGADGELITGALLPDATSLYSGEFADSYSGTSYAEATQISLGSSAYTSAGILYIKLRDKAGKRNGYFYGIDSFIFNRYPAQGATTTVAFGNTSGFMTNIMRTTSEGAYATYTASTAGYGVYPYQLTSAGLLKFRHRYNENYTLTIDGTYLIEVYLVKGVFANWYGA